MSDAAQAQERSGEQTEKESCATPKPDGLTAAQESDAPKPTECIDLTEAQV